MLLALVLVSIFAGSLAGHDPNQMAALSAVPGESDPGGCLDELVVRDDGKARHYAGTSTTWNSDDDGTGVPCSRMLAR